MDDSIRRARTPNVLVRLWLKVREPRVISVLYFAIYVVMFYGGVTALLDPPRTIEGAIGVGAMTTLAAMLAFGGLVGAPSSLVGVWWLERVAVLSVATAAAIYGSIIATLQYTETGNRQLQLSFVVVVLCMQAVRWHRIRLRPYDPARH